MNLNISLSDPQYGKIESNIKQTATILLVVIMALGLSLTPVAASGGDHSPGVNIVPGDKEPVDSLSDIDNGSEVTIQAELEDLDEQDVNSYNWKVNRVPEPVVTQVIVDSSTKAEDGDTFNTSDELAPGVKETDEVQENDTLVEEREVDSITSATANGTDISADLSVSDGNIDYTASNTLNDVTIEYQFVPEFESVESATLVNADEYEDGEKEISGDVALNDNGKVELDTDINESDKLQVELKHNQDEEAAEITDEFTGKSFTFNFDQDVPHTVELDVEYVDEDGYVQQLEASEKVLDDGIIGIPEIGGGNTNTVILGAALILISVGLYYRYSSREEQDTPSRSSR